MPPNSTNRFLTASVRAVRSFKRHSHSAFCQEPARRPLRLLRPPRLLGPPKTPGPPGPPGPPRPPRPPRPQGSLKQSG